MEWYYAVGDKQMGPVSEEEFKRLASEGTIRPETLVWNASMDGWKLFREVSAAGALEPAKPEPAAGEAASGSGNVVCRECGKIFKADEVVKIENAFVCGECKPVFLQRLREGDYTAGAAAGDMTQEEVLASDYEVNISEALNASWDKFQRNVGIVLGACILVFIAMMAANMIPYLSMITGLLLTGPLWGGLWYFFIRVNRGEEAAVGDAFAGFNRGFWQLVLVNIVTSILTFICMLPLFLVLVSIFGMAFLVDQANASPSVEFGGAAAVLLVGAFIVSFAGVIFLTTIWLFALALVVDKGLAFWDAMELSRKMVLKHFWGIFLLVFVGWIMSMVGLLLCGVGLLFTGPVAFGAWVWQYEKMFGNLRAES